MIGDAVDGTLGGSMLVFSQGVKVSVEDSSSFQALATSFIVKGSALRLADSFLSVR